MKNNLCEEGLIFIQFSKRPRELLLLGSNNNKKNLIVFFKD
jgi:hypothetical protein